MHLVCINYTYERFLTEPAALLKRYETLTGWANAVAGAGARVSVVQRFGADAESTEDGVLYRFVRDPAWRHGGLLDRPGRLHKAVEEMQPDVVHANGLQFGRQALQLRAQLQRVPVLLQDHANAPPRHPLKRWRLRKALHLIDAVSFVSRRQARPWVEAGLLSAHQPVVELMEGSSRFQLIPRATARARTGLSGAPLCLWVGRLNENKDPMTVLRGFAKALPGMGGAHLVMAFGSSDLLPRVRNWLKDNPAAANRVTLLGKLPHLALEDVYNSADLFLLGSHREGSGYAVLEALACGVTPVLTDIPSFQVLTGGGQIGRLWEQGDSDEFAHALKSAFSTLTPESPEQVRRFFEASFSWAAIGKKAMAVYEQLLTCRREGCHHRGTE